MSTAKPCQSGTITGVPCEGEATSTALWMPPYLRESHRAAGYTACGKWSEDAGADRIDLCDDCRAMLTETETQWLFVVTP